jgi:uncharacterized protein DUF2530
MKTARRPAPPPLEANDQAVTAVITAAWAIALVVLLVLRDKLPAPERWWIWTCLAGVAMGLFGLWYVPALKRGRARSAQRRAQLWSSDSKTVSSTDTPGRSTRS